MAKTQQFTVKTVGYEGKDVNGIKSSARKGDVSTPSIRHIPAVMRGLKPNQAVFLVGRGQASKQLVKMLGNLKAVITEADGEQTYNVVFEGKTYIFTDMSATRATARGAKAWGRSVRRVVAVKK